MERRKSFLIQVCTSFLVLPMKDFPHPHLLPSQAKKNKVRTVESTYVPSFCLVRELRVRAGRLPHQLLRASQDLPRVLGAPCQQPVARRPKEASKSLMQTPFRESPVYRPL